MSAALIVFSLEPWDGVWRRNQYLVDGLLRADPALHVLFVEPARDVPHEVVSRRRIGTGAGARLAEGYGGRLVLFQPTKWLPRLAGPLADELLWRSLRRALRRGGLTPGVLWINDPGWAPVLSHLDRPALYDMTDDWLAADRSERQRRRIVANERALMSRCAAVVVCSPGLRDSRRGARPDVLLIPNAVDVARYRAPAGRPNDLPPGPCALYVGTLHEDRLDLDLVVQTGAALATRGATLALVGPVALSAANVERLGRAPGVVVLGAREHATIPGYLQHAAALVVPHVVDGFTDSLDPLKLYEYRAVGRPIVSTRVAGFRDLEGEECVTLAAAHEFAECVAEVVGAAAYAQGACVADVAGWDERVARFRTLLAQDAFTASGV